MRDIKEILNSADAIIIGAGAGLSTAAGINYGEKEFEKNFPELVEHYGFTDMYTSSFYNFKTEEERWSYWAKHINYLCISLEAKEVYKKLFELVKDKNYFIITTNVDRQFIKAGFNPDKVFEIQGALTKMQCSKSCHNKLYDNTNLVKEMLKENDGIKIPTRLVPKCPVCGEAMEINLRKDNFFVEDNYWEEHNKTYHQFIENNKDKKIVFLEFGVGFNTPSIIRYPFEDMAYHFKDGYLIRLNDRYFGIPNDLEEKAVGLNIDILEFLKSVK